ncbi:MAG: hypothetical protein IIY54_00205 [Ruminococcus sp.]|nr:hypothetical protein [Ruminococcus sp.]
MSTPQVKEIRIHHTKNRTWVEYEMKTTTNRIDCLGWSDAEAIAHTLDANVEKWISDDKKGSKK